MSEIVLALNGKVSTKPSEKQRVKDNVIKVKKFLNKPSPYALMIAPQVNEILTSRGLMTSEVRLMKIDEKKDLLMRHDHHQMPESNREPVSESLILEKLFDTLHCQAFLPNLNAEGLEYCKIGHESEVPLVLQFLNHSKSGDTSSFVVDGISRPGLVQKKGKHYVKGTIDFVAISTTPGNVSKSIIGIEIKTRASPATFQNERKRQAILDLNNPNKFRSKKDNSLLYR